MSGAHPGAFSVPLFRIHPPYLGWHRVEHPIRGLLLAVTALLAVALGAVAAPRLPSLLAALDSPPRPAVAPRELPREWRYERKAISVEHMYGRHVRAPSVDYMYMKPRPPQRAPRGGPSRG